MSTSVLVTGISGSGKSTTCRALNKLGYEAVDIESVHGLYELVCGKTGEPIPGKLEQISEDVDWNCKKDKLTELLNSQTTDLAFYCGGMSNTEDVWSIFDVVIILTVSDLSTIKRLSTRNTGEFGSSDTSRNWVLSWKHDIEERWPKMGGIRVDAESDPTHTAKAIIQSIRNIGEITNAHDSGDI